MYRYRLIGSLSARFGVLCNGITTPTAAGRDVGHMISRLIFRIMSMSDPSRCQRNPSHPRTLHKSGFGRIPMSGRCPDPYCAGYMPAPCLCRDQMNLVLTNLKPRTKQCAICVKLRDGVVSRLVQEKHKFIRTLSTVICRSPHHRSGYRCRGQICGDNPQSADHHPIPRLIHHRPVQYRSHHPPLTR